MAYATNLKFLELSGLGIRVVDENVGTGDGAETDFDLDHDNLITGGYTLYHAASGSNSFTALTETTHYTLDKESGRIVLTGSGVTEVGTDIIYATYWYSDIFTDTVITDMIEKADAEIDKLTGQNWTTPTLRNEYQNGRASSQYPTTDRPFQEDWDQPDFMVLEKFPVTKIDQVYFLSTAMPVSAFYNYDDGLTTYTDITDDVNSSTEAPINLFDASPATGDYVYIGSSERFLGLDINLSTVGAGSPSIDWEYYDGSSWTDLTETDVDSGASTFTASGKFTWAYPYGWTATSVNSSSNYYWIRGKIAVDYTGADPIVATVTLNDAVAQVLEPRQYSYDDNGTLYILSSALPNGTRNVRVDYYYGYNTTPEYIEELSVIMASIKAYVNLSGGSYDDATSYTLGSKSVTIGEVYVNIREVLNQFKSRKEEILNMIGKRADLVAI